MWIWLDHKQLTILKAYMYIRLRLELSWEEKMIT